MSLHKLSWRRGGLSPSLFTKKLQAGEAATKLGEQTPQSSRVAASAEAFTTPLRPRWGAAYATAKIPRRQPSLLEWASFDAHRSLGGMSDHVLATSCDSHSPYRLCLTLAVCGHTAPSHPGSRVFWTSHGPSSAATKPSGVGCGSCSVEVFAHSRWGGKEPWPCECAGYGLIWFLAARTNAENESCMLGNGIRNRVRDT